MATNFVLPDPRRKASRRAQLAFAQLVLSVTHVTHSLRWLAALAVPTVLIAVWSLAEPLGWRPVASVMAPSDIIRMFAGACSSGELQKSLASTIGGLVSGGLLGVLLGLVTGGGLGLSRRAVRLVLPTLKLVALVPALVWLPLWFAPLGNSNSLAVLLVAQAAWAPVFVGSVAGITASPQILLEMGRALGLSRGQLIWRVLLPSAAPSVRNGIRRSLSGACATVIAIEIFAALIAPGADAADAGNLHALKAMLIAILSQLAASFVINQILGIIERRFTRQQVPGKLVHDGFPNEDSVREIVDASSVALADSAVKRFHSVAITP